jgi:TRAP-type C4-dicarboxylate transport system permease small subunit
LEKIIEEKEKKYITKIPLKLVEIVEVYIPTICFAILFIAFITQIFFRYVLNQPLTWTYELTVVAYTWVAILTASYARKTNENVVFSVIYDKVSPKIQVVFRIIGNIFITSTYAILLYPAYKQIQFSSYRSTSVLKIPLNIVFYPFLVFLVLIMFYSIIDIIKDFKELKGDK